MVNTPQGSLDEHEKAQGASNSSPLSEEEIKENSKIAANIAQEKITLKSEQEKQANSLKDALFLSEPDTMKKEAEALVVSLSKSIDTNLYKINIEVRGKFQKINIVNKNGVQHTEPQIGITIYEPGKVRLKLIPYLRYKDEKGEEHDNYEEKSALNVETTIAELMQENEIQKLGGFLETDDYVNPKVEKVEVPITQNDGADHQIYVTDYLREDLKSQYKNKDIIIPNNKIDKETAKAYPNLKTIERDDKNSKPKPIE